MDATSLTAAAVANSETKGIFAKLLAKPAEEAGEMIGDWIRHYRWRNQAIIAKKTEAYAAKHGLSLHPIQLKALLPLIDGAALEDDATLQDLWAKLIANVSATSAPVSIAVFAAEFLGGIASAEAKIIEGLVQTLKEPDAEARRSFLGLSAKPDNQDRPFRFVPLKYVDRVGLDPKAFDVAIDNLLRYNVLSRDIMYDLDGRPREDGVTFSRLGWEVVQLLRDRSGEQAAV